MAKTHLQYAQELERQLGQGKQLQEAHDEALRQKVVGREPKSDKDIISRAWARLKVLFEKDTARTKQMESQLKTAGLTDKEIGRLRGKK